MFELFCISKKSSLRKCLSLLLLLNIVFIYAQDEEKKTKNIITTITINHARQTDYKKDEETGNDSIFLQGSVELNVQKDESTTTIKADSVKYDRITEMLYAEGNVEIITKKSSNGNETIYAKSVMLNTSTLEGIFDDGKVIQTQSDLLSLPSGSTLVVFSDIFGKTSNNSISFKNSSLTFCEDENPHWHIDATRTWLLPGGEFAFFNALLYVGVVPVMYFPLFYYPKDELIFNPVFGYTQRGGYNIQTTTYLYGRKPLDTSSSTKTTSTTDTDTSSTSSSTKDSLKSLYNFMKPNKLKNQQLEGLVLHNLDTDYSGKTSSYLKFLADWYSNLGIMLGLDGKFAPSSKYLTNLDFNLHLGFSNTVFNHSGVYSPLSSYGFKYQDESNFLGLKLPFRYGGNINLLVSKPIKINLSFPFYSDPYFSSDFNTRSEYMDWISYLIENINRSTGDTTESTTTTETSSYTWNLTTSFNPTIMDFLKPYISSFSISTTSSVNISSLTNTSLKSVDEWTTYTPSRKFYYPSQITPVKAEISLKGTIFQYPSSKSTKEIKTNDYKVSLNAPDEIKSEKEKQQEKNAGSADEKNDNSEKKESEELSLQPILPELAVSTNEYTIPKGFSYSLNYDLSANYVNQIGYSSEKITQPEYFNWNNIKSSTYIFKTPLALTSQINYGGDFLSITNSFNYNAIYQGHPYISFLSDYGGYTLSQAESLVLADYEAQTKEIVNVNVFKIKPFKYLGMFSDSSVSWKSKIKLYHNEFIGDINTPWWQDYGVDWTDSESVTQNIIEVLVSAHQLNKKFVQNLTLTGTLPPQDRKYTALLELVFPHINFKISSGLSASENDYKQLVWKKEQLQQSFALQFLNSKISLSESFNYNLEDSVQDSLKLSLSLWSFQFSYVMEYSNSYDFVDGTGWVKRTFENYLPSSITDNVPSSILTMNSKALIPSSLSISYAPKEKTFYSWFKRISVAPGLNTSIVADLIRPTNSYFLFTPSLSIKINNFFTFTFSTTSRNSVIYRYFQTMLGAPGRISGEQNIFIDLINSFRFDDDSLRQDSGFKLKSFNFAITHDLHDWDFSLSVKIEPRIITEYNVSRYDFSPYISLGIVWKPMESMKTQIIDKYGTWSVQ